MIENDLQAVEQGDRLTLLTEFGEIHDGHVYFDGSDTGYIHLGDPAKDESRFIHLGDETLHRNGRIHPGQKVERSLIWPRDWDTGKKG